MKNRANEKIRVTAKTMGVRLWQVADSLGISEPQFSRKMRHELPADEREKILGVIAQLAADNARAS